MQEVPVVIASGWSDAKRRAYVIADNKLALNAGWDEQLLSLELADLADDFDLNLVGFTADEIESLKPQQDMQGLTDEDAVPDAPEQPVTVLGDIWLLGRHRLMCGDSTDAASVARLMAGKKAALIHADPPYGMGKESDGIANDNLYREKLDSFQMNWWRIFRLHANDNASAYIWGNALDLWRLWYCGGLSNSERLTMRNEIVWDKGSAGAGGISHQGAEALRSLPQSTERCLFFMLGAQESNNDNDDYWEGWENIRSALDADCKKMGWGPKDIKRICGVGMYNHWFTKSQWSFIPEEHYKKLQAEACKSDAFKRQYNDLKSEFYATRGYFDNTHDNMTDVWSFPRVMGKDRYNHATPKPVNMIARCLKSSLPSNGLCVEPFGGSGATLIAAEKTARICYTMELQREYVDVIIKRWQDFTGKQAIHAETGQPFPKAAEA
jgi:DNA modification methylase